MMVYLTGDGLIKDIHKQRKWIKQAQFGRKTDGGVTLSFNVKLNLNSKFAHFWAYPLDDSPPIEVRIARFGPERILAIVLQYSHFI